MNVVKPSIFLALAFTSIARAAEMPRVKIAENGKGFVTGNEPFVPWGFNYDRDDKSRLLEDYWDAEWSTIEQDFAEMKELGANVVRVHLQAAKFLRSPKQADEHALKNLGKLLALAEKAGLYLDLTGLGCYRKRDVPSWYDALDEPGRWHAQATFWSAVAGLCKESPAVFCYDLMNEPVVPGGRRKPGDWLGPPLGEFSYVQCLTLDQAGRPRAEIARKWVDTLTAAIRKADPGRLVTVGLVDWSLDRPGMYSGTDPLKIADPLDFVAVHLYPEAGAKKLDEALATLRGFAAAGKPVVVEETFPLKCGFDDFRAFLERSRAEGVASGWFGFYWGKTAEECRRSGTIPDALMVGWLDIFRGLAPVR